MATPRFEDALNVTPLDDGRNWRIDNPFHYDTDVVVNVPLVQDGQGIRRIEIPEEFITDFASVPRWLWWLFPPTGRYARATVVHDYLYRTKGKATRTQADAVLFEAMKFPCGVGFWTRWIIYLGVRAGGRSAYITGQSANLGNVKE